MDIKESARRKSKVLSGAIRLKPLGLEPKWQAGRHRRWDRRRTDDARVFSMELPRMATLGPASVAYIVRCASALTDDYESFISAISTPFVATSMRIHANGGSWTDIVGLPLRGLHEIGQCSIGSAGTCSRTWLGPPQTWGRPA
jgi:hypothetical protein